MTSDPDTIKLTHHSSSATRPMLDTLCLVYADAYEVEPTQEKTGAFRARTERGLERAGFELVMAAVGEELVGFAFGYPIPEGNTAWWQGLDPEPPEGFTVETGTRTFILAEIEIRRAWQGRGVGRRVHDELLAGRLEERATLATNPDASRSHAIYEAWGWRRIGRIPGKPGDYFGAYELFLRPLSNDASR
ncbi:GNAT family N-acetyltransferase [Thermomonospora umbrina]|nr:GNAT family N-acetyltransferase [Thermomonospora umbrina]